MLITLVGLPLGALAVYALDGSPDVVERWLARDPDRVADRVKLLLSLLGVTILVPVLAASAYAWRIGSRVSRAGRFPAPGMVVVRDTRVRTGWGAQRIGWFLQLLAVVAVVLGVTSLGLLWRIATVITATVGPGG